ncbi:MobA/MobL family protein [Xanthomonas sp. NCPPB 2632]|uniref:MobA/MobL family protein n=1 Tax=Xanthomonas sp. NCPPB 2632 TaxID=3240912 RepID=UPI0035140969
MSQHARPHLQTHNRSAGHSAVAGAAYRLGLRLYDERTKTWHDYRKRALGEEVVRALTVAPPGAPAWATDPAQLWNRVEQAERRKDAQIARDYRIPVPFGLSDDQAGNLAEELARYISVQLRTPVSMGLHRDAELDVQGNLKPKERQGYHAHLYFPTRELSDVDESEGATGFGAKLSMLSNKRTSSAIVEQLNAKWAELANRFTAENNLPADYTHLSYERQGLPIVPQPVVGPAATAMERKGFFTRKGDALREIIVMSEVYKAAQAAGLTAQHEGAIEVARLIRAANAATPVPVPPSSPSDEPIALDTHEVKETAPDPAPVLPRRGARPSPWDGQGPETLLHRFQAVVPAPDGPEASEAVRRLHQAVGVIERVLAVLVLLARRLRGMNDDRERRMAAKLSVDYELDGARAERSVAEERVVEWEANHPWQMRAAKAMPGSDGKPREWRALHDQASVKNARVQRLKSTARAHVSALDDIDQAANVAVDEQAQQAARLDDAVSAFVEINPGLAPHLLAAAYDDERPWLEPAIASRVPEPPGNAAVDLPEPEALKLRLRTSMRIS